MSINNVDSNMNSSNHMKILFKALIYFELEQTSNKPLIKATLK